MTLQDNFGRRFSYLRLSVTDVCNYRCNYCLPDGYQCSSSPQELSVDEIHQVATLFAGLGTRKIRITGGEPSVRKDLPDIIRTVASVPGIDDIAITTNGWKLPTHLPQWLDAGLTRLNVSIDSLDPRQFAAITGHNRLQDLLNGLTLAHQSGLSQIKVNAVLMNDHNADQFPHFLEWLRTTPVTLRFIELMQTGDNQGFFERNHISGNDLRNRLILEGWQPVVRQRHDGPAQELWHPDYVGRIGLIMPYSKDFCSSCNRLRVSSTGQLHLCLFGEEGYDLRPLLSQPEAAATFIREALGDKKATHYLHSGNSGSTAHFAQIGG